MAQSTNNPELVQAFLNANTPQPSNPDIQETSFQEEVGPSPASNVLALKKVKAQQLANKLNALKSNNQVNKINSFKNILGYKTQPKTMTVDITQITITDAIGMLQYPRLIGQYKNKSIELKSGPHGLYIEHGKTRITVEDAEITLQLAIDHLEKKQLNIIKDFKLVKVLNGPYGPYIRKGTKNISIPKDKDPLSLTLADCEDIIKNYKPKAYKKKYKTTKKNSKEL